MSIPKDILKEHKALNEWSILTGWRGSIAHGMYIPNKDPNSIDDKDIMSVCVPPIEYYFGLNKFGSRGTKEIMKNEWDIVIYEVQKFVHLLSKGNPNVLSLLWLDDNYYLNRTPEGNILIANREVFNSKKIYHSFVGYAHSQLHKMTNNTFNGYMGQKRKLLVEKYGYDTKNAAHLIRLLRMAIEFLVEGRFIVQRPDSTQLLDIKTGKWTLEEVKEESKRLFDKAEDAYINSSLPSEPDSKIINELLISILERKHGYKGNLNIPINMLPNCS